MKKRINNRLLYSLCLVLLAGLMCGCTDEKEPYEAPAGGNTEKTVTFSVKVPGASMPSTYALSETDENEVTQIAVLLFDPVTGYTYQPLWCNTITSGGTNGNEKTFTVKVPVGTYDMMILANANNSLGAALTDATDPIAIGDSKADVAKKLMLDNTGKWDADASSPTYIHIPMWGEINGIMVSSTMANPISTNLVRMLAKIDVTLTTPAAKANFKLKSVRLYNYYDMGQVAPNNILTWTTTPSIPALAVKPATPATSPLAYTTVNATQDACTDEIYTFEAGVGSSANHLTNTCLVVGGRYTGDTQDSYYRIDFANTASGTTTYLPLLRNHSYEVGITDVSGSGLGTAEEAFKSRIVKIQATILPWNDGDMSDVVSDGQYKLGVSQGAFTFTREARTTSSPDNILTVTTNFPTGWKVEKIVDGSGNNINSATNPATGWLNLDPDKKTTAGTTDARLILTANAGSPRVGFIHLSAGRLTYVVKVTQNSEAALMLTIRNTANTADITDLVFAAGVNGVPDAQSIVVSWMPVTQPVSVSTAKVGTNPEFKYNSITTANKPGTSGEMSYTGGSKTLNIQPDPITAAELATNPFYERISKVDFTVNNGVGYISKSVFFRQMVYNVAPVIADMYIMDGTNKSFTVRSNSPFIVEIDNSTNTDGVISSVTTTGDANTTATGTPVNFNIINDLAGMPIILQRDVKVTIKSPKNLFNPVTVTLNCVSAKIQPKANSYIISPAGIGVLIPVSRANESLIGTQLGANDVFTAELVWTDNPHTTNPVRGIGENAAVKQIQTVGAGKDGYLLVMPGTSQGNSIVAIKKGATILWSWHIWVTNYIPTPIGTGKFMDRNLGAIGESDGSIKPGQVRTKGLLYQWGRKDPFPGSTKINADGEPTLYATTGSVSLALKPAPAASPPAYNIKNAVENPTTFYTSTINTDYDWYNSTNIHNDALWGPARKSVYDPCPPQWRIPMSDVWYSLTESTFPWNDKDRGRTNTSAGGFYPCAGIRSHDGTLQAAGERAFYITADVWTPAYQTASNAQFMINDRDYGQWNSWYFLSCYSHGARGAGYSVRCVSGD